MSKKLTKVIYFDENSVTDYIQIIEGGKFTRSSGTSISPAGTGL